MNNHEQTPSDAEIRKNIQSPYSVNFVHLLKLDEYKKYLEYIVKSIRGKKFVDIGGGELDIMEKIALESQVSAYFNVDILPHERKPEDIRSHYVNQEVSEFLIGNQELRDEKGVNFCMNGLDLNLFQGNPSDLEMYLFQIMKPGNILFGVKASALTDITEEFDKKKWKVIHDDYRFFIFEKR